LGPKKKPGLARHNFLEYATACSLVHIVALRQKRHLRPFSESINKNKNNYSFFWMVHVLKLYVDRMWKMDCDDENKK
jgi:hypothetical protein